MGDDDDDDDGGRGNSVKNDDFDNNEDLGDNDFVCGMVVEDSLLQLQVTVKQASKTVYQVIHSARANATHNHGLDPDRFLVAEAFVGKGFFKKRISYHAKGKCGIKVRQECRLTVVVREITPEEEAEIAKLKVNNFRKLTM